VTARSERVEPEGGRGAERCRHCGSADVHHETRDAWADEHGNPPPREAYGEWGVCDACGREWPVD
jgi:hypothetical protein